MVEFTHVQALPIVAPDIVLANISVLQLLSSPVSIVFYLHGIPSLFLHTSGRGADAITAHVLFTVVRQAPPRWTTNIDKTSAKTLTYTSQKLHKKTILQCPWILDVLLKWQHIVTMSATSYQV